MNETIMNLTKAFIGESQARNRYTIYAKIAKNEGYEKISEIFLTTADQEREHAKWLFRMIQDLKKNSEEDLSEIKVEATAPTAFGNTVENLKAAIGGETYEFTSMYPEFAAKAEEEGFKEIADRLRAIAVAEKLHAGRYGWLLSELGNNTMFKKEKPVAWVCRKCGFKHEGLEALDKCPSCGHPQAYFEAVPCIPLEGEEKKECCN
ncbi:rubrerythrin family protein [Candidatus Woesearchaeota archaeon]|jgi:rubrerythrin|nr:rubrerythrin family protein [Candidatus Woesearchaeota archaeon]MBT5271747.1 rubrerythrin family protein [Candidatus Woesearchaeota archaeon]MBT6041574.1 rubrerythrin family protein [Candidatus Woesearchaeota archaeon]MBT6337389.1 rubrerythrin family protein [Candidatus Woesearchaeota archaeon]MBT7927281.1 rubrerythrin family protein [Candidatus Woesearchaeota archaeon]